METEAVRVVREFCGAWQRMDIEELLAYFAADAVYHNMPMEPVSGTAAIRSLFEQFMGPADSIEFEILHLAADGNTVHTERVDRFQMGERSAELPVAGVFEVTDGKIAAWRDYFDLQVFLKQTGMG